MALSSMRCCFTAAACCLAMTLTFDPKPLLAMTGSTQSGS